MIRVRAVSYTVHCKISSEFYSLCYCAFAFQNNESAWFRKFAFRKFCYSSESMVDLMSHVYAKLHIRPTVKYVANSCVCVALRLCYPTTNPRILIFEVRADDDLICFLFVTKLNIKLLLQYCKEKRIFVRSLLTFNELHNTLTDWTIDRSTEQPIKQLTLNCYLCETKRYINCSECEREAARTICN